MNKNMAYYKTVMTYDDWLQKYKGRTVYNIDINEHTKWSKDFKAWKQSNIEKV